MAAWLSEYLTFNAEKLSDQQYEIALMSVNVNNENFLALVPF